MIILLDTDIEHATKMRGRTLLTVFIHHVTLLPRVRFIPTSVLSARPQSIPLLLKGSLSGSTGCALLFSHWPSCASIERMIRVDDLLPVLLLIGNDGHGI